LKNIKNENILRLPLPASPKWGGAILSTAVKSPPAGGFRGQIKEANKKQLL